MTLNEHNSSLVAHTGRRTGVSWDGLFELRLKGAEDIARVFFCTLVGRRIIMLHSFVKKTPKTPKREIKVAQTRMKEIKHANS